MKRSLWFCSVVGLLSVAACSDDNEKATPGVKLYEVEAAVWDCSGSNCQDVYDFSFVKGSNVTFDVSNLTDGSVAQLALYAPGTALGGTNLFTESTSEIGCVINGGCDLNFEGYTVPTFKIPASGVYRFAVTRNHGYSCGSDGEYDLMITSDKNFVFKSQTVDNGASAAPDNATQVCE